MLRKLSKFLSVVLVMAFIATNVCSDFLGTVAWAADGEAVESIQDEEKEIATAEWEKTEVINAEEDQQILNGDEEVATGQEAQQDELEASNDEQNSEQTQGEGQDENEGGVNFNEIGSDSTACDSQNNNEENTTTETAETATAESTVNQETATAEGTVNQETAATEGIANEEAAEAEAQVEYPAQEFSGDTESMHVDVQAGEGAFPAGTTMELAEISISEAIDAAEDALEEGRIVKTARGVDITFRDAEGGEIEPADPGAVVVSISLHNTLEGERFDVVHKEDDGSSGVVASASADGAEFVADSFSVYIVVGSDDAHDKDSEDVKAVATYRFHVGNEIVNTQLVKSGDTLYYPEIPVVASNQEFLGWFRKDADGNYASEEEKLNVNVGQMDADVTIDIYAKIQTTYYLTFKGVDKEVICVKKLVVIDEAPVFDTSDQTVVPKKDNQTFEKRWTSEKLDESGAVIIANAVDADGKVNVLNDEGKQVIYEVYPVISSTVLISFNKNDDGEADGATESKPIWVKEETVPDPSLVTIPVGENAPKRAGYTFSYWYKDDENVPYDWSVAIPKNSSDFTLTAKWTPNAKAPYTVVIWEQDIKDTKDITDHDKKRYDHKATYKLEDGDTTVTFDAGDVNGTFIKGVLSTLSSEKGFSKTFGFYLNFAEAVKIDSETEGKEAVNKIGPKGDTIINLYYDRELRTINFYNSREDMENNMAPYTSISGLYGQSFDEAGCKWPVCPTGRWRIVDIFDKNGNGDKTDTIGVDYMSSFIIETRSDSDVLNIFGVGQEGRIVYVNYYTQDLKASDMLGTPILEDFSQEGFDSVDEYGGWHLAYTHQIILPKEYNGSKVKYSEKCEDYFIGFTPYCYSRDKEGAGLKKLEVGTVVGGISTKSNSYTDTINFYFKRIYKKLELKDSFGTNHDLIDDELVDEAFDKILYEMPLSLYKDKTPKLGEIAKYQRDGFEFDGDWYKDPNGQEKFGWSDSDTMPAADKILYAHYNRLERHVTLVPNGGTITGKKLDETDVITVEYLGTISKPDTYANISKDGFELIGWFYENGEPYEFGAVKEDVTIYAHWRKPGDVVIKYDPDSPIGSGEPTDEYNYMETSSVVVQQPPKYVTQGYIFIGWTIEKETEDTIYYPNNYFDIKKEYIELKDGKRTVTLKAMYQYIGAKKLDGNPTLITYHSNDERKMETTVSKIVVDGVERDLKENESIIALTDVQAFVNERGDGYKFIGWGKNPADTVAFIKPGQRIAADNDNDYIQIGKNNHLYAIWVKDDEFIPDPPKPDPPIPDPPTPPVPTPPTPSNPIPDPTPDPPGYIPDPPTSGQQTPPTAAQQTTPATNQQTTPGNPVDDANAEEPGVLAGRRNQNLPAVLGARRGRTGDTTNLLFRILTIIAAGVGVAIVALIGRKEEKNED